MKKVTIKPRRNPQRPQAVAPLVSCLMYCPAGWRDSTAAAARDYAMQTWERREMVVVTPANHVDQFQQSGDCEGWKIIGVDGSEQTCRNMLLANRDGELLTWWEETARHHPARLAVQADRMLAEETTISGIGGRLYYRTTTRHLYALNMMVRKYNWQQIEPFTAMWANGGGRPWPEEKQPEVRFVRDRAEKAKSTALNFMAMYMAAGERSVNANHGPLSRQGLANHLDSVLASLAVWRPFEGPIYISGVNGVLCDYPVAWNRF